MAEAPPNNWQSNIWIWLAVVVLVLGALWLPSVVSPPPLPERINLPYGQTDAELERMFLDVTTMVTSNRVAEAREMLASMRPTREELAEVLGADRVSQQVLETSDAQMRETVELFPQNIALIWRQLTREGRPAVEPDIKAINYSTPATRAQANEEWRQGLAVLPANRTVYMVRINGRSGGRNAGAYLMFWVTNIGGQWRVLYPEVLSIVANTPR